MNKSNLVLKMSLAALMAGSLGTANAETLPGTASATVIAPLTLAEATALDFGSIAGGTGIGTVQITSVGGVVVGGGASAVPASGATQATFNITGAVSTAILVTVDITGTQLDDVGAGVAMPISAFTTTALPVITSAGGLATFDLGATLDVGINQLAGAYDTVLGTAAPYSVTVNYN